MFANRTLDYRRYTKRRETIFKPLSTSAITQILGSIAEDVGNLSVRQNRQCLPSFSSKKKRELEIEGFKRRIGSKCSLAEKEIGRLLEHPAPQPLLKSIYTHYMGKLKMLIKDYRAHQQNYLEKISLEEETERLEEGQCEAMLFADNVREIRRSILELTSVLMDMKVAVAQQTLQIDRIDFYFESINQNLEGANSELEKMPRAYRSCKDTMLYFLLMLCIMLAALSMLKMFRTRSQVRQT
jgi:hypothetical protein